MVFLPQNDEILSRQILLFSEHETVSEVDQSSAEQTIMSQIAVIKADVSIWKSRANFVKDK